MIFVVHEPITNKVVCIYDTDNGDFNSFSGYDISTFEDGFSPLFDSYENGLLTLRNDIFIIEPNGLEEHDEDYYNDENEDEYDDSI